MKTKFSIIFLQLFLSFSIFAQHNEPAIVSVVYQFVHINDLKDKSNPIKTDMILRVGQTNSLYNNLDIETQLRNSRRADMQSATVGAPRKIVVGRPMAIVMPLGINSDLFFQINHENKLIIAGTLGVQDYIIESPWPVIDWRIENEVKTIDKYVCQKAIGMFGGRIYTAWFTKELPFQNGPWKLCGLPGLILEAADSKNEVQFQFKALIQENNKERIQFSLLRPVKVSEEAFNRSRNAFLKNPIGTIQSQISDTNMEINLFFRDVSLSGKTFTGEEARAAIKHEEKRKISNPLELTKSNQ